MQGFGDVSRTVPFPRTGSSQPSQRWQLFAHCGESFTVYSNISRRSDSELQQNLADKCSSAWCTTLRLAGQRTTIISEAAISAAAPLTRGINSFAGLSGMG